MHCSTTRERSTGLFCAAWPETVHVQFSVMRAGCGRAYVPMTVLTHVPVRVPMQVNDLSLMELGATLALAAALYYASSSCSLLRRLKVYCTQVELDDLVRVLVGGVHGLLVAALCAEADPSIRVCWTVRMVGHHSHLEDDSASFRQRSHGVDGRSSMNFRSGGDDS